MPTRVFLGNNYFGAGNFGDDLTLAGFVAAAAPYPDIELTACTAHDLAGVARRFPRVRWLPDDDAVREDALRHADVWLALGDTPFQLDSGPWLLDHNERERRRCAALKLPMFLLGVGSESREAAADARARSLLAAAEHVWTRDAFSAETLRPFIDASRLSPGADVAHLAFAAGAPTPRRAHGVVGLLLAFERLEQFDVNEVDRFVQRRASGGTRWLVQEVRALPYLERWILERLAPETRARLAVMDADYATGSVEQYLRAFGAPETTITSRYHAALVAAWHGSQVLVVSRSAKLRGIARELDLPHVDRVDSHAALEAALVAAAPVSAERLREVRARAHAMCEAFFACCAARAASAPPTPHPAAAAAAMHRLPAASLRATIDAEIPRRVHAGEPAVVRCSVTNRGDAVYVTAPPNPIELCYRWYDTGGAAVGAGTWIHTPLPRSLPPGCRLDIAAHVAPPPGPGAYTLALTLLQTDVAWFDDVDPANGLRMTVAVGPPRGAV